jgi:hypothetical protein
MASLARAMTLTTGQVKAIRDLRRARPDLEPVLIGASALALQMDFTWRQTNDLDLSLSLDLEDLHSGGHCRPIGSPIRTSSPAGGQPTASPSICSR